MTNGPIWEPTGPGDNVSGQISDPGLTSIAAAVAVLLSNDARVDNFNTGLGCALMTNSTVVTANTSLSGIMKSVLVDATAGPITVTLPKLTGLDSTYEVSKIDATGHTVTLAPFAGDPILIGSGVPLTTQGDFVIVFTSSHQSPQIWIPMAARTGGFPSVLNVPKNYTTTATVGLADSIITVTAAAPWTLTLPLISAGPRRLWISKQGTGTNVVTVKCAGSDTFADGTTTRALTQRPDYFDLFIDPTAGHWAFLGARQNGVPV